MASGVPTALVISGQSIQSEDTELTPLPTPPQKKERQRGGGGVNNPNTI